MSLVHENASVARPAVHASVARPVAARTGGPVAGPHRWPLLPTTSRRGPLMSAPLTICVAAAAVTVISTATVVVRETANGTTNILKRESGHGSVTFLWVNHHGVGSLVHLRRRVQVRVREGGRALSLHRRRLSRCGGAL